MNIQELFFELSHKGRYQILKAIASHKKKHGQLEEDLDLPGPEVTRHLKRLLNMKMIEKESDGFYNLTAFGQIVFLILPFLENVTKYVDFVNSHDFAPIPLDIFFQIAMVPGIELRTKTMENIELWGDLVKNANQYIYSITDQLQTSMIPLIQRKIESGNALEIRGIIERDLFVNFTKTHAATPFDPDLLKKIDILENVRLLKKVSISLTITEGGALIFLRAGDSIDYQQGIYGKSPAFLVATKKIFDIFWGRATAIKPSDINSG